MIAVAGAGMGGLAAAAFLARRGRQVVVFEARNGPGGLASSFEAGGLRFDSGPYVLLDRPGLEWAFREIGEELSTVLDLIRIDDVYRVDIEDGPSVTISASVEKTAAAVDRIQAGAGEAYARFVDGITRIYEDLRPMLTDPRPGVGALLRTRGWRRAPFLLRSLSSVLERARLPEPLSRALSIWTHVAGQQPGEAPSPMAFVPALIHRYGTFVPRGGIGQIPLTLERIARAAGAEFRYGARVRKILTSGGRVTGIDVEGEKIAVEAVISDVGGLRTYLELLDDTPAAMRRRLESLPLQTPGVCAYLAIQGQPSPPYLQFRLPLRGLCRLLILPGLVDPSLAGTARLLGPVDRPGDHRETLEALKAESWWRKELVDVRVVASRTPPEWGADFHLFRDSMNPVMTAKFMREGRMAHRSPVVEGLYLAGSSTHPGQWVSFCAISGIFAAKELAC